MLTSLEGAGREVEGRVVNPVVLVLVVLLLLLSCRLTVGSGKGSSVSQFGTRRLILIQGTHAILVQ